MMKLSIKVLIVGILTLTGFVAINTPEVLAADTSNFHAGRIIDDVVMENDNTMSVSQIQAFLNSKMPSCDTNGAKMYNSTQTRKQYAASRGVSTPFKCIKDYSQGGKSAARIIYEKGKKYDINPQVLIVLLQKEQGLVTDDWPWPIQYRSATGYGCPDTAPCDSQYYGLSNQLDWAAKMFRSIIDRDPNWYSPYIAGNNPKVYWHPNTGSCGGKSLAIENWSTAGLYSYTPYRPNQAALNAGYGSGDSCSSYGNRNFFLYFSDWFGSPRTSFVGPNVIGRYEQLGGENGYLGKHVINEKCNSNLTECYQRFENGYILWKSGVGAWDMRGAIRERYTQVGVERGFLGHPASGENIPDADNAARFQEFEKGRIYWKPSVGAWYVHGRIGEKYEELGGPLSPLGFPKSPEKRLPDGSIVQEYEGGEITWKDNQAATSYAE